MAGRCNDELGRLIPDDKTLWRDVADMDREGARMPVLTTPLVPVLSELLDASCGLGNAEP